MQLEALLLTAVLAASANAQCTVGDVASSLTSALAAIQSDSQDTADKVNAFEEADGLLAALAIQNGYGSIVNDVSAANAAASAMASGAPACDQSAVSTGFNDMAGSVKALLQALIDKYSDLSGVNVESIVQNDLTGLQPSVIELESYALEKLDCTIAAAMYPEMDSINALFGSALSVYSATSQQAPAAPSCAVESSSAAPTTTAASSSAAASSAAASSAAESSAAASSAAASSAAASSAAASSVAESSAAASSASSAASAAAPSSQAPSSAATAGPSGNITTTINSTSTVTVCPTCTDKTVISTDVVTVCPTCTEKPVSTVNAIVTDTVTDCPSSTETKPATNAPVSVEVTETVTDCPSSTENKPVTHAPVSVEVTETVTDCPSSTVKAVTSAPVEAPVTHKVIKTATVTSCPPSSAIYHNSTAVASSAIKPAVVPSGTTAAVVQANGAGSLRVYLAAPAIALALSLFA